MGIKQLLTPITKLLRYSPNPVAVDILKLSSPTQSLVFTGLLLGFTLTLINYGFMTSMVVFFLLGSKATKFRGDKKEAFEKDFKKGTISMLSLFYFYRS